MRREADRAVVAVTGMTVAQVSVLATIDEIGKPTQREVATTLGLNEPAVAEMVKRLLESGYISRSRSSDDKRTWTLRLSDDGRAVLRRSRAPFATVNQRIAGVLSDPELEALGGALESLITEFGQS
jgi:DNA-binding MarR family transcriptional regulator